MIEELLLFLSKRAPEYVDRIFQLIEPSGHKPTKTIWMTTITALLQTGNVTKALEYEERMKAVGFALPASMTQALASLRTPKT